MRAHFGQELPSLGEMLRANPRGVASHFLWNFKLLPNGLQVLLFNAAWGHRNPDYAPIQSRSAVALTLALLLLAVWAAGAVLLVRDWGYWWGQWLRGRLLTWLALLCVAAVSVPVIATQRPRPSYLFPLGVLLMALTGVCVQVLVRRLGLTRRLGALMPAVMVALPLLVPCYFADPARRDRTQPLRAKVERLAPYQSLILASGTNFLAGDYSLEVFSYLGHARCQICDYGLLNEWKPGRALAAFLDDRKVNLFYLDEHLLQDLSRDPTNPFAGNAGDAHWKLLACGDVPGDRWKLFRRTP
jgi:hypothetical protein